MPKGCQWSLDDVYNARRQAEIQAEANAQALRREYERQKRDQERERDRNRYSTVEAPRTTSHRPAPSQDDIYDMELTEKLHANREAWAKQKGKTAFEEHWYRSAILKYTGGHPWRYERGTYGYLQIRYQKHVEELLRKWMKQGFSHEQAKRAIELEYIEEGWRIYEDKYMEAVFAEFYKFVPRRGY